MWEFSHKPIKTINLVDGIESWGVANTFFYTYMNHLTSYTKKPYFCDYKNKIKKTHILQQDKKLKHIKKRDNEKELW